MKILGRTDERTTCDKCGKQHLKVTVAIELDDNSVVYYGTTCAAKALRATGIKTSKSALDTTVRAIALANKWLAAGYDAKTVASGIWNKIGYSSEAKNGKVFIYAETVIIIEV